MKLVPWYIVAILFAVILIQRECQSKFDCPTITEIHDTLKVYDTAKHNIQVSKDKLIPYKVVERDTIPEIVDTTAILRKYFATNYIDYNYSDTNIKLIIVDTVSENAILGRGIEYQLMKPVSIITNNTIIQSNKVKNKYFVGLQLNGGTTNFGFVPEVMISTKKDHVYHIGYDVLNGQYQIGAFWKIKLKK